MANTFELIASSTVGSSAVSSISFTSIPSTYTDLCIKLSTRSASSGGPDWIDIVINGDSAVTYYASKWVYGTGSALSSSGNNYEISLWETNAYTANTFMSADIHFVNYANSNQKVYSADTVTENNATAALTSLNAGRWSTTSAITSLSFVPRSTTFTQYSTAYLYGIKNA